MMDFEKEVAAIKSEWHEMQKTIAQAAHSLPVCINLSEQKANNVNPFKEVVCRSRCR